MSTTPAVNVHALNEWVRQDGPDAVATAIGVSRATLLRINGGLNCNPLTARAVNDAIAARTAKAA